MQTDREFSTRVKRLERLLGRELGLSSGDLPTRVARARRKLPRAIKQDMLKVAEAAHLSGHPRIAPQIDRRAVDKAYGRALMHLRGPEMADLRKGRWLGAVGALTVNLFLVFALVFGVLVWRSLI